MSERDKKHPICIAMDDELRSKLRRGADDAGITLSRHVRDSLRAVASDYDARETLERVRRALKGDGQ